MRTCHIRRGYNLPLKGKAEEILKEAGVPNLFSVRPTEFHYVKPKLQVSLGDSVKIGTPLFFDKRQPNVFFVSPAAGKIHDIQFGERKAVERIVIERSGESAEQFPSFRPGEIFSADAEKIKELLLQGGMWPFIRQRPFDIIASPDKKPDSIFVNAMDTAPLAANSEFSLKNSKTDFKSGIDGLRALCPKVNVVVGKEDSIFQNTENVSMHCFTGPHPAGLVGTHVHYIEPLHAAKTIWYLNARDVVYIGRFLLTGQFPTDRVAALAGTGLKRRGYFKILAGASIESLLKQNQLEENQRILSGGVLTGKKIQNQDSIGFYDDLITVIPEDRASHFLGWMLPGLRRHTWSRAFFSALIPRRSYSMNTNANGEERALVKTGDYEKVTALDILPSFLIKAVLAEDIELMEQLGIYETAPEDVALCSYICPSKTDFTGIVRSGLDMILAETH